MIKVAIVGTGNISQTHIKAFQALGERCRIVALCDIYPEKAEERRVRFELGDVAVYDDHETMLANTEIDLVNICTPPYTHAEIAINCMRAGAHVLIEKPMAASVEECDRIREVEAETGRIASSIAQNRFIHDVNRLKRVLDSGLAGDILHAQVDSFWWRGHCYYDLWWRGTWKMEGGGCTLNHAVHHIDMLLWLLGRPEAVTSVLANLAHDNAEVEDLSISIWHYPRALATVTGSVVHHGEDKLIQLQGEKARIAWPLRITASTSMANGFPEPNHALEEEIRALWDAIPDLPYEGHLGQIEDVVSCVEAFNARDRIERRPAIGTEDGRNTVEVITAIYKAGTEQAQTALPISAEDDWYRAEGILEHAHRFYEKTSSQTSLGDDNITLGRTDE